MSCFPIPNFSESRNFVLLILTNLCLTILFRKYNLKAILKPSKALSLERISDSFECSSCSKFDTKWKTLSKFEYEKLPQEIRNELELCQCPKCKNKFDSPHDLIIHKKCC